MDSAAPHEIREVLFDRFGWKAGVVRDDVVALSNTDNAAAICSTPDSAGADGMDKCVSRCEQRSFVFMGGKEPHVGGCYLLCSLAMAPCHAR